MTLLSSDKLTHSKGNIKKAAKKDSDAPKTNFNNKNKIKNIYIKGIARKRSLKKLCN